MFILNGLQLVKDLYAQPFEFAYNCEDDYSGGAECFDRPHVVGLQAARHQQDKEGFVQQFATREAERDIAHPGAEINVRIRCSNFRRYGQDILPVRAGSDRYP